MAIGKTGGFASVTAPNVDFGAMTERFVDKELARDEANKAKREAKKKAEEDAKIKENEQLAEDIKTKWAEQSYTGKTVFDDSVELMIKTNRDTGNKALRSFRATGDSKYQEEYEKSQSIVKRLVSESTRYNEQLAKWSAGREDGSLNPDSFSESDRFASNYRDGRILFTEEDGALYVTSFDLDINGIPTNFEKKPANESYQKSPPVKASKFDADKATFVENNKVDDITEANSALYSERTRERNERIDRLINTQADKISKNPDEFANWYINKNGETEFHKNRGKFEDSDVEEFREYIVESYKDSYPKIYSEQRNKPTKSSGGGDNPSINPLDLNITNLDRSEFSSNKEIGGFARKGAAFITPKDEDGNAITLSKSNTGKQETLHGIVYDAGGLKIITREPTEKSTTIKGGVSSRSDSGDNLSGSTSSTSKEIKYKTRVYSGDLNSKNVKNWLSAAYPNQDWRGGIVKPLYNNYVNNIRNEYSQVEGMSNSDVIKWAKKNIDKSGNLVEGKGETNEERKIRLGLK